MLKKPFFFIYYLFIPLVGSHAVYSFFSFYSVHKRFFKVENSQLTEIERFSEHLISLVLFHSPYLTVCISFDTVTGFVFRIMQEKRIYECPVIHKSCINKATLSVRKADVQDSFFQIVEMLNQFIFCNQIMSLFQMKRFKILLKIYFFFLCKTYVFL